MAQAYTPPTDYKSGLEQVLTEAGNTVSYTHLRAHET